MNTYIINNFIITELTPETINSVPVNEIFLMDLIEPSSFGLKPLPIDAYDADGNLSKAWFSYGVYKKAVHVTFKLDYVPPADIPKAVINEPVSINSDDVQTGWRGYVGEGNRRKSKTPSTNISTANRNRSGQFQTCAPHQRYKYPSLK
jgi:hypothetical protein